MTADAYRERLHCPRSWYATGSVGGVVIGPEISFVTPLPVWSTMLMGIAAAVLVVAWIGRREVRVEDDVLYVDGAKLPVRYIDAVAPLDARTMRRLLGPDGDPAAFLAVRGWVGSGVQILLDDPDDPVPYWAVSTRHPEALAAALGCIRVPRPAPEESREPS